jgi:endonuclease III
LEIYYGKQLPSWPTDPYLFLVWWHCGYPASDASCAKGWESLNNEIGVDPDRLLSVNFSKLALALKSGGMMAELRAMRLKDIAERIQKQFGGDLRIALKRASVTQARAAIKKFPGVADPGADRILLFGGISPVAAVPSNCPHVLVRIQIGREPENYRKTYSEAQRILQASVPGTFDARMRAYLLLKCHGQHLCKLTNPKCSACPVRTSCAFFVGKHASHLSSSQVK